MCGVRGKNDEMKSTKQHSKFYLMLRIGVGGSKDREIKKDMIYNKQTQLMLMVGGG